MATDYGTDIKALDDLPDPEELVSAEQNVAYAQGRRFLQPPEAQQEIGDEEEYECMDVRDALGRRMDADEREQFEADANRVAAADPRIESANVDVTFAADGSLTIEEKHELATGTFDLVLSVDKVTASLLKGG